MVDLGVHDLLNDGAIYEKLVRKLAAEVPKGYHVHTL